MARRRRRSDPEDLFVEALEHTPPEFLACREMAHPWRVTSPFRVVDTTREDRRPRGGFRLYAERRLTCQRCGMVRSDAFAMGTRSGHTTLSKISSQYEAPEGYAISGVGRTAGLRDLLYGVAFEAEQQRQDQRRRRSA